MKSSHLNRRLILLVIGVVGVVATWQVSTQTQRPDRAPLIILEVMEHPIPLDLSHRITISLPTPPFISDPTLGRSVQPDYLGVTTCAHDVRLFNPNHTITAISGFTATLWFDTEQIQFDSRGTTQAWESPQSLGAFRDFEIHIGLKEGPMSLPYPIDGLATQELLTSVSMTFSQPLEFVSEFQDQAKLLSLVLTLQTGEGQGSMTPEMPCVYIQS